MNEIMQEHATKIPVKFKDYQKQWEHVKSLKANFLSSIFLITVLLPYIQQELFNRIFVNK